MDSFDHIHWQGYGSVTEGTNLGLLYKNGRFIVVKIIKKADNTVKDWVAETIRGEEFYVTYETTKISHKYQSGTSHLSATTAGPKDTDNYPELEGTELALVFNFDEAPNNPTRENAIEQIKEWMDSNESKARYISNEIG